MSSVPNETDSSNSDEEWFQDLIRTFASPEVERGDDPERLAPSHAATRTDTFPAELQNRLFQHGMAQLPNEIIAIFCVLLFAGSIGERTEAVERFQLVCRRFRDVALGISQLWALIDDRMAPLRMDLQASRCPDATPTMSFRVLRFDGTRGCKCERWRKIKELSHHYISGKMIIWHESLVDHDCFMQFEGWNLPFLSQLWIEMPDQPGLHALTTGWEIPSLKYLACTSTTRLSLSSSKLLKTLNFCVEDHANWFEHSTLFLAQPPFSLVRKLLLGLETRDTQPGDLPEDAPVVMLEHVVDLYVCTLHGEVLASTFSMLQLLATPNLRDVTMEVHTEMTTQPAFFDWLRTLKRYRLRSVLITLADGMAGIDDEQKTSIIECLLDNNTMVQGDQHSQMIVVVQFGL